MGWVLIKQGEPNNNFSSYQEWQLDTAEDIATPPQEAENASPSSKAWTGDYSHIWNKTNSGEWTDMLEGDG